MEKLVYNRKEKIPDKQDKTERRLCNSHVVGKVSCNTPTEEATEDALFPKVQVNVV